MSAPCPTRSHSIKCVFSGSTQESASFVPRDRFFSERMEESPQIITLNYILIWWVKNHLFWNYGTPEGSHLGHYVWVTGAQAAIKNPRG